MFHPSTLPADEQPAVRDEVEAPNPKWGGEDIDRAISRDRKVA